MSDKPPKEVREEDALPVSFRGLYKLGGVDLLDTLPQDWPLEKWFASACDVPMQELSISDLARACRQQIHPEAIFPFCLKALEENPVAGELYEGELLAALIDLPRESWLGHPQVRSGMVVIVSTESAYQSTLMKMCERNTGPSFVASPSCGT